MKNYYITEKGKFEIIDSESINLSYKNITEVVITDLPSCKRLYLYSNKLESVEINLSLCNYLDLHNNKIKSVEIDLPMCNELDLSNNELKSVELKLPMCNKLYLDNNKLKSVELSLPMCDTLYLYNNILNKIVIDLPVCHTLHSDLTKFIQSNGDVIVGFDGIPTIVDSERKKGEFIIYKGRYKYRNDETFIASRGKYHAHGDTMKKAIEDCNFKFLQETINIGPYFAECKEKGVMSVIDYRLLTGACESGCKNFLESKSIESTEMKFDDAMKLLEENNPYGWDKIKELI